MSIALIQQSTPFDNDVNDRKALLPFVGILMQNITQTIFEELQSSLIKTVLPVGAVCTKIPPPLCAFIIDLKYTRLLEQFIRINPNALFIRYPCDFMVVKRP